MSQSAYFGWDNPPVFESGIDANQYLTGPAGVKEKQSRAAYESPGSGPGETLRFGDADR